MIDKEERESMQELVKNAKKYAKEYKEPWENILADMIMWSMVNLMEQDPDYYEELRERYVDKDMITQSREKAKQ